jgi:pimeloyl-ACP methyl ester carboxylesterase
MVRFRNPHKPASASFSQIKPEMTDSIRGYLPVNGLKMYYEIYGEGEPLVLIHGGGSTIQSTFGRIIPLLSKNRKLIAVELQGHGRTNDRNSPESFEQDAEDVAALLKELHIPKASFFGFSNGGNTAMQIAIRHPEIVNRLIIASAFYKREGLQPGFFESMEKATINDMPQSLKTAFLQVNPDSSQLLAMFNKDRERMLNFKDWKDDDLRSIKAPSLIICGDRDVVVPEHSVVMSGLIKDSRLLILPSDHGTYLGAVESSGTEGNLIRLTVDIIEEFLNDNK